MDELVTFSIILAIVLFILYTARHYQKRLKSIDKKLLNRFLFLAVITNSKFEIKFTNRAASFIKKIIPIDYDNNKSYCFVSLNNDEEPTKFLTFKENDEIFFLSKETKKSNIEKVLMLGTIMEEGYKLVNDIDIKSILKYTGELLQSDWVRYYVRKNDKIFTEKEQWQNPNSHMYGIQDIKDISLLVFNYTQPYFFIRKHHLISDERKEIWKKFNIDKKLIIPIWYDEKLQRQISFAYSKGQEPNNALIHVVIEITNIIFQLKNQFEKEHIKQIQMEQIRQSLFQYAKNEKDRLDRKTKLDEYSLKEQEELIQALKEKI